jgi:hypothetical protein
MAIGQIIGAPHLRRYTAAATTSTPPPGDVDLHEPDAAALVTGAPAEAPELPWRPGRVRRGPALLIVGIVAFISIGGFILAAIGSRPGQTAVPIGGVVAGTRIAPAASAPDFRPIDSGGEPPSDILSALVVPAGSRVTSTSLESADLSLYSGMVVLSDDAGIDGLITFYEAEFARQHWQVSGPDAAASGSGEELFATKASSDGYYWEVGVDVSDATPSITPALNGDTTEDVSTVSLTLFERDDDD